MATRSPPLQPSLLHTPASPPPSTHSSSAPHPRSLRSSSSSTSLRPSSILSAITPRPPRSRSPSPSPTISLFPSSLDHSASPTAALAHATLGIVNATSTPLPPSPALSQHTVTFPDSQHQHHPDADDEVELLKPPPTEGEDQGRKRSPSSVGFVEPDQSLLERDQPAVKDPRPGGRARKRSFIGLGFGGGGGGAEDDGGAVQTKGGFARRLSTFGGVLSGAGGGGASSAGASLDDLQDQHRRASLSPSSAHSLPPPIPPPIPPSSSSNRKASGPKALLRRAKSFGTSPVLAQDGFSSSPVATSPPPGSAHLLSGSSSSASPTAAGGNASSPVLPLPRLSTSSLSLDPAASSSRPPCPPSSASRTDSPSGYSTPITPSSASPYPYHPHTSASYPPTDHTMVLPEPVPSQPHWLFQSQPAPQASSSSLAPSAAGSGERQRRRSADEDRSSASAAGGKGKEKERGEQERAPTPGKKRNMRRATLGGLFGRASGKTDKERERERGERDEERYAAGPLFDSPQESPALSAGGAGGAGPGGGGGGSSMPSLPSLPSLQLSQNPYRMSWAFGGANGSPQSSPEEGSTPVRRLSLIGGGGGGSPSPSRSGSSSRPSLSITTTPSNVSPAPSSPTKPSPLSSVQPSPRPSTPTNSGSTLTLPPPLQPTKSTDSGATLHITAVPPTSQPTSLNSSTSTVGPSLPPPRTLSRAHSASSPPLLRRSNSYAPPPAGSSPGAAYVPLTRSPLSSPTVERAVPLYPAPPASSANSSPSLARTLIKTRQARSHSDASDRRAPGMPPPPLPQGGGYFALPLAGQRNSGQSAPSGGGNRRPSTSDSLGPPGGGGGGRTSVFGSLGSFFHSSSSSSSSSAGNLATSTGMSRSSSAATATTAGAGTPIYEGGPSEFGALFGGGGSEGGKRRSGSVSRPGTGRKRGLSVGAGIGSLFGAGAKEGRETSPAGAGTGGRARSGSGSSAQTSSSAAGPVSGATLAPPDALAVSSGSLGGVGGRVRALTDPNRRFSFMHGSSGGGGSGSSGSLAPPGGGSGSRPGTADGSASPPSASARGGRARGSSLSAVVTAGGGGGGLPDRPPLPRERKVPQPRVEEGETPEEWVRRLCEGERPRRREGEDGKEEERQWEEGSEPLPRGEITRALAASSDPFHTAALAAYLRLFPFHSLALDIALRVFLSSASLPSETQQIDRVMEAFARRFVECNPGVFVGRRPGKGGEGAEEKEERVKEQEESDTPYVLAFSMVMLNTDHFNPNAKSKMTKADYVKNTRIDGLAPEILEYLYDQITLAPFIFVDSSSVSPSPGGVGDDFSPSGSSASLLGGSIGPGGPAGSPPYASVASLASGSGFFGGGREKGKVDPYHLIATGQTQRFRVDVESHIPSKSPFSFTGTTAFFDATKLHTLFARAPILQITTRSRSSSKSSPSPLVTPALAAPPLPGTTPSTISPPGAAALALSSSTASALDGSPLAPTVSNGTFIADPPKRKDKATVSSLKITKTGLLSRKEDLAEGGKKAASRKWKGWSVVLTGSQLLFFKDPHFAASLQHALDAAAAASEPRPDDNHVLVFSIQTPFKPDAVLSLANSAAVYDSSYSKYRNVFRLVAPAGRQYLFQAHDADNLNSWLHAINYAAAFKSANVRIRPLVPVLPSAPASTASASSVRSSPRAASPRFPPPPAPLAGLPQPKADVQARDRLGSTASSTADFSPRGSLATSGDEDETLQPTSLDAVTSAASNGDGDASLPRSLQEALRANGAATANGTGVAAPAAVLERTPAVHTPEMVPSPRPSEASFAAVPAVTARADLLRTKINELDAEISRAREALQADLCLAKHLSILTPFRSSTRERVLTAIPPIEKRVRHARMNLAKLLAYREVLARDLLVEDRETERLVRKHSHHRTLSRRGPSSPRPASPARRYPASPRHSFEPSSSFPTQPSALSRSTSSLRPPRSSFQAHSDSEHTPRNSFESTTDSLNNLFAGEHFHHPTSLTDDELDRLQLKSPPLMQRSKTETDWQFDHHHASPHLGRSLGHASPNGLGVSLHPHHADPHAFHPSEDELEVPPTLDANGGAGTPIKKRSTDPNEALVRGLVRDESREVLATAATLAAPPTLEQRHSH
ncbi:hypothetical protein JCM8097_007120 [Rhodosporidiobolus ruineniae]